MTLFVTSSPFIDGVAPATLSNANGFIDRIRGCLPKHPNVVFVASDPKDHAGTCQFAAITTAAFADAGMAFSGYQVLDGTSVHRAYGMIAHCDFVVLCGGHVPTQNAFFQKIGLRQLLGNYPGVVMGISAGSMNCADVVYSQPEESGESAPEFQRFLPGLGLTHVQVLPHYQKCKVMWLDGKRLFEDITYADSVGNAFYAIPDFSYIVDDGRFATLFGEGYRIQNGILERLTSHGDALRIK